MSVFPSNEILVPDKEEYARKVVGKKENDLKPEYRPETYTVNLDTFHSANYDIGGLFSRLREGEGTGMKIKGSATESVNPMLRSERIEGFPVEVEDSEEWSDILERVEQNVEGAGYTVSGYAVHAESRSEEGSIQALENLEANGIFPSVDLATPVGEDGNPFFISKIAYSQDSFGRNVNDSEKYLEIRTQTMSSPETQAEVGRMPDLQEWDSELNEALEDVPFPIRVF